MDVSQTEGVVESVNSGTNNFQNEQEVSGLLTEPKVKKSRAAPKAPPNADRPHGKSLLPLARVQRIMKADKELPSCNKEAVFLISVATEEFIKRLGQAGQLQAVKEKRSIVQRKDVVNAVRRADEFIFLEGWSSSILATRNLFHSTIEILSSSGAPGASGAPAKRKTKAHTAITNDTESMNIKEVFGRGRAKPPTTSDDAGDHSDAADPPDLEQNNFQEHGDSMDVS